MRSVAHRELLKTGKIRGYIRRVIRLVTTSAAAHTRWRFSQALRRIARPSLL
jgi:hypothetical protein